MEMNQQMKELLNEAGIQIPEKLEPLHPLLRQIADSGLIELDGCFFLKGLLRKDYDISQALQESEDRTGLECSINNLYIQSIIYTNPFKEKVDRQFVLAQGIHYAYYLAERLCQSGIFQVILSFTENEPEHITNCSVRFHLIRLGETWVSENLEDYSEEAILVM